MDVRLSARLSPVVCSGVECAQGDILSRISSLLPEEKRDFVDITTRRMPLDLRPVVSRHCLALLADFAPDTAFRFSLRPSAVFGRYLALRRLFFFPAAAASERRKDVMRVVTATSEASAVSLLVVGAAVYRSSSLFKIAVPLCAAYSAAFVIERLFWTAGAKARAVNRQFEDFAKVRLESMEDVLASHCRELAQKELHSTLVLACGAAESAGLEMKTEMERFGAAVDEARDTMAAANGVVESANEMEHRLKVMRKSLAKAAA